MSNAIWNFPMEIFTTTKIYLRRDIEKDLWLDIMNDINKIVLFQSANRNIEELKNDFKNIEIKKKNRRFIADW